MQEVQTGQKSDKTNDEIIVILEKILEYKCISTKQHKQTLILSVTQMNINIYIKFMYTQI